MLLRKILLVWVVTVLLSAAARASDVVRLSIPFSLLRHTAEQAVPTTGASPFRLLRNPGPRLGVEVDSAGYNQPITVPLFSINDPPVQDGPYTLRGRVAYSGVGGVGDLFGGAYLEMWSTFSDGSSYFTRTLAEAGPMQVFSGRSGFRRFWLVFKPNPGMKLKNLTLNLVMGSGRIELIGDEDHIGDLQLVQDDTTAAAAPAAPWSPPTLQATQEQINLAASLDPGLLLLNDKQNDLQLQRYELINHAGPGDPNLTDFDQRLRAVQIQMDLEIARVLLKHAERPAWLSWLIAHTAGWWWGVLIAAIAGVQTLTARSRLRWLGLTGMLLLGTFLFGWGMAACGTGSTPTQFGKPLIMAAVVFTLALLMPSVVRRQQTAELRRMAVLDAA